MRACAAVRILVTGVIAVLVVWNFAIGSVLDLRPGEKFELFDWQEADSTEFGPVPEYALANASTISIRRWGCHRRETPLIFVHIGKAGGGLIRARLAAAAKNYDRDDWHDPWKDKHYYPVQRGVKAKFCNSLYKNHLIPNSLLQPTSFEGNSPCNATTPLALAIACPEHGDSRCLGCKNLNAANCHTVYVGHNNVGSELHWLPPKYLQNWWEKTPWNVPAVDEAWNTLLPESNQQQKPWCGSLPRPKNSAEFDESYQQCSLAIAARVDKQFQNYWRHQQTIYSPSSPSQAVDFSPIYASLPVQRVTVVREPFSWLVSKFFFHRRYREGYNCDDIPHASTTWALQDTLSFVFALCGNDCSIRYENGLASLQDLEAQATRNLRHSFSVVGLLEDVDTFYDMLNTRVAYVDMSLHLNVEGNSHERYTGVEEKRCREMYQDKNFQQEFKDQLPTMAMIDRLYKVAVEVNRFQQEELKQCAI